MIENKAHVTSVQSPPLENIVCFSEWNSCTFQPGVEFVVVHHVEGNFITILRGHLDAPGYNVDGPATHSYSVESSYVEMQLAGYSANAGVSSAGKKHAHEKRDPKRPSKPPQPIFKKSHSHSSDKDQNKRHHPLDLNSLKGHADSVTRCVSPLVVIWQQLALMECYYFVPSNCSKCFFEVRYHLDEDPKTLKVFPIPLHDSSDSTLHYDRLSLSPDGKILATTHGSALLWVCMETGKVLDTAEKARDGDVLEVDTSENQLAWGKWLRVRVNINVHRPLKRGKLISLDEGKKLLTWFKYERLPDFCYICGIIDHQELDCKVAISIQKDHKKLHWEFGPWLRANANSTSSTIFGKLNTNYSGLGSFTNSNEEGSSVPVMDYHAKGKKVVDTGESDKSETPESAVVVTKEPGSNDVIPNEGGQPPTLVLSGDKLEVTKRGQLVKEVGDKNDNVIKEKALFSGDRTKMTIDAGGNSGCTLDQFSLIEIRVESLTKDNKNQVSVKKWKRSAGKTNKGKSYSIHGSNTVRKRRALQTISQSATKKIRDDMEVDGEVQTKSLAEVGNHYEYLDLELSGSGVSSDSS
ncbi:hypothetical protein CRYUN_Cryun01aG0241600 [Craigia yunnanensis]